MVTLEVAWPIAVFDDGGYGYLCASAEELDALAEGDLAEIIVAFDSRARRLTLSLDDSDHVIATPGPADVSGLRTAVSRFAAARSYAADRLPPPDASPATWLEALHAIDVTRRHWFRRWGRSK